MSLDSSNELHDLFTEFYRPLRKDEYDVDNLC